MTNDAVRGEERVDGECRIMALESLSALAGREGCALLVWDASYQAPMRAKKIVLVRQERIPECEPSGSHEAREVSPKC